MSDQENKLANTEKPKLRQIMRSDAIMQRFEEVVGKNNAEGYIASVLNAVAQSDSLMECTPNSIIGSALRAATLRLSCDPALGYAYLVPFKGKKGSIATLIVGYKGLIQMALRTGQYLSLELIDIYESDELVEDRMTGKITMKLGDMKVIPFRREKAGELPVGYLVYIEMFRGFKKWFYMGVEECEAHGAKYSKTYNNPNGLWKKDPIVMHRKTVLRQALTKWGYFDPHDIMNMSSGEESDDDGVDYLDGVTIKEEIPDKRLSKPINVLFGHEEDEPEQEQPDTESSDQIDGEWEDQPGLPMEGEK